jgi:hypothetical protein
MNHQYGTKEFYAEQFADLIADVQHDSPEFSDNLIAGFLLALDDWRKYHVNQILELDRVEFNFNEQSRVQTETT